MQTINFDKFKTMVPSKTYDYVYRLLRYLFVPSQIKKDIYVLRNKKDGDFRQPLYNLGTGKQM